MTAPDKVALFDVGEDEAGMRLDRWFHRRFPKLPQSHLNKIVRKGEVRIAGKRAEISTRLEAGQSVRVPPLNLPPEAAPNAPRPADPQDAAAIRAMILFEDRDCLVLNKPYGLAVQGGSGTKRHIDGMLAALANKQGERPVLVHRLDRDTSGVLLIAKSRKIAADLGAIFRSRGARKIYWALVEGVPKPAQGRISLFLAKGEAMGADRSRTAREPRRYRADARRQTWRGRRAAFADALRGGRQGRAASRPGCRCARSPGAPINCAPIARRSAIRSSATPNTTGARPTIPREPIRCAPCRRASSRSCICWRAA